MMLVFRPRGRYVVVAFGDNDIERRLEATQGVPTNWSGLTRAQEHVLRRPAYLRKREGGPFGATVFAPTN